MDFLFAIAGLVGLVWGAVILLRGGLLAGCLMVLLAGLCFGHPFFNLPLGPIPLTADRLLLALIVVQFIAYRRWGWTEPKPLIKSDIVLLIFITVLTMSTFTHDWWIDKPQPLANLVFDWLMPLVLYWLVRQTHLSERSVLWIFGCLAGFGIYLVGTAVAEAYPWPSLVFPSYIASSSFHEFLGRARGPILNPAGNGVLIGACLGGLLMWWPRLSRPGQFILATVVLPLFAAGVYSTLTRSAWMGGALGLAAVVAFSMPRAWRAPVVTVMLISATASLALSWDSFLTYKRDKDLNAELAAESAKLRPILATVAWHMFLDRPVFGCGYGQYIPQSRASYFSDRSSELPLEKARRFIQHNVWLSILVETGIVGAVLFTLLNLLWLRDAWRLWSDRSLSLVYRQCGLLFLAALGAYLPNAMFHDVSLMPMINMLMFFLAGVMTNLVARQAAARSQRLPAVVAVRLAGACPA